MSISINGKTPVESTTAIQSSVAHGTYHMANNPAYFEPMRTNTFEFVATGLENIVKSGMESGETGSTITSDAQETIRLSVSQASIPTFTQNVIEVKRGNTTLKYAGVPTFSEGSITVNDYIGQETLEVLYGWQALSYNVLTEKIGVGQDYKKTCYLMEYTPDFQLVRTWVLYGCWISGISENNFDSNSDAVHTASVTIQYDRAQIDRSSEV